MMDCHAARLVVQPVTGESDVCRFLPGFTFTVYEHPRADVNRAWWISEVRHEGQQPGVLRHEAPADRGLEYKSVVTAIPDDTRFVPEINHKKVRIDGLQSAIVTGPSGEEVYTDEYGRIKVQFHWDRLGASDERTTCWVRVADSWAGTNFGFIQVPRIGQEVMVEFMEGDPDRPVITGRVYNPDTMPPWQLPEQKTLSGIQSREFKAGRRNQLVLDDSNGQIQAQLSSDHDLSQLNLGYITRVNHVEGRKDFRGEGFELRSDSWGGIRAGKGLVISTDARSSAERHQKDIAEAVSNLDQAASQHQDQAGLAVKHEAQDFGEHQKPVGNALSKQNSDLRGSGQPHGELTAPHILISSPAGIATTTPNSTHIHSGDHTAVTAGSHISLASNKSFIATAVERVSLFAHSLGMKLFAAKGKVEIQAQSDDLEIIADKVLRIISAQETVRLSAPEEILLTAGGSYIRIGQGIEEGTPGQWLVHAAQRSMDGPDSMPALMPVLPNGGSMMAAGLSAEAQAAMDTSGFMKVGLSESSPQHMSDSEFEKTILCTWGCYCQDKYGRNNTHQGCVDEHIKANPDYYDSAKHPLDDSPVWSEVSYYKEDSFSKDTGSLEHEQYDLVESNNYPGKPTSHYPVNDTWRLDVVKIGPDGNPEKFYDMKFPGDHFNPINNPKDKKRKTAYEEIAAKNKEKYGTGEYMTFDVMDECNRCQKQEEEETSRQPETRPESETNKFYRVPQQPGGISLPPPISPPIIIPI